MDVKFRRILRVFRPALLSLGSTLLIDLILLWRCSEGFNILYATYIPGGLMFFILTAESVCLTGIDYPSIDSGLYKSVLDSDIGKGYKNRGFIAVVRLHETAK